MLFIGLQLENWTFMTQNGKNAYYCRNMIKSGKLTKTQSKLYEGNEHDWFCAFGKFWYWGREEVECYSSLTTGPVITRERVQVKQIFDFKEPLKCLGYIRICYWKYPRVPQSNEITKAGKCVLLLIVFVSYFSCSLTAICF